MTTAGQPPLIMGIESSCDETGVAFVRGCELLADEVASSVDQHARFGGVVPEIASRAHLEAMVPTTRRAFDAAGLSMSDVDAVAVTAGPGLAGALLYADVFGQDPDAADPVYPSAAALGELAVRALLDGTELPEPRPLYLRRPDAQVPGAPKKVRQPTAAELGQAR